MMGQSSQLPACVNNILLKHDHTQSFAYCSWFLLHTTAELGSCQGGRYWLQSGNIYCEVL